MNPERPRWVLSYRRPSTTEWSRLGDTGNAGSSSTTGQSGCVCHDNLWEQRPSRDDRFAERLGADVHAIIGEQQLTPLAMAEAIYDDWIDRTEVVAVLRQHTATLGT